MFAERTSRSSPTGQERLSRSKSLGDFPHRRTLEQSLGRRLAGRAIAPSDAAARLGCEAFTDGSVTHFREASPRLDVVAHEAVHQMQHAGDTADAFLGAEGQAAAVARRVASGRSARDLIGSRGSRVAPALRPYTEVPVAAQTPKNWQVPSKLPVRVAADASMAATQDGAYGTHDAWALPARVTAANAVLAAQKSVIKLNLAGGTISGPAPDGKSTVTLTKIEAENTETGTKADTMKIWADCGRAARDVIGVGKGTGSNSGNTTAVYEGNKTTTASGSDPVAMKDEIMKQELGGGTDAAAGWKAYNAMTPAQKDAFDKKVGINRYAAPGVGQAFNMSTGGKHFSDVSMTWNFHWAGVVLRSGGDVLTLENYAIMNQPKAVNTDWNFQMYGPPSAAGQTFYDQHLASHQHGDAPTAMTVKPR
jgi:hypothetical protein